MRRLGVIHPELARTLASLGHGDVLVVADAGLPIPASVERIDLAYRLGAPSFADVLQAFVPELVVERATLAAEVRSVSPAVWATVAGALPSIPIDLIDHEELKRRLVSARAVVRTGEATPYANVLLTSGVPF